MALSKVDLANQVENQLPQSLVADNVNFRNIIINGSMDLAQRGTSTASITSTGYHTLDRFETLISSLGTWTQSQSTTVPSSQGFAKSLKMDNTTADASPSSGDYCIVRTKFEGQNLQYLKFGTSSAESLTLSFWVRSNKTGTYIAELYDSDNTRQISQSYTISSADTWEKKTLTYDGDTTGAFDNDNALSLSINFWLGAGTDFTSGTLSNSWSSVTSANRAVGQVNLGDSTANEWYITGVQLEAGTTASDFEFLPYDVNLQRCYRYYQMIIRNIDNSGIGMGFYSATNNARLVYFPKVTLRTTPSLDQSTASNSFRLFSAGGGDDLITSWNIMDSARPNFIICNNTADASGTAGQAGYVLTNTASSYFALNAEL